MPSETADEGAPGHNTVAETEEPHEETKVGAKNTVADHNDEHKGENSAPPEDGDAAKRRPAKGDEPFEQWEREAMEKLLGELRGHLG
jgi:phospholipase D1/2